MYNLSTTISFFRSLSLVALVSASVVLAGCGGGGGNDDDDDGGQNVGQLVEMVVISTPELDGTVGLDPTNPQSRPDEQPGVGDGGFAPGEPRKTFQAFWSFDLSQIPAGARVRSARLSLYVRDTIGDPNTAIVLARMDHVNYGATFPLTLFPPVLEFDFDQINDLATVGRRELDVTAQVQADVAAGRSRSQYRMRGAIDNNLDANFDAVLLTDGEDSQGSGELPMLILELE